MAAVSKVSRLIDLGSFDLQDDSVMDDIRRAKLASMRLSQPRRDELFSIEVLPSQACMAYRLAGFADLERLQGAYTGTLRQEPRHVRHLSAHARHSAVFIR